MARTAPLPLIACSLGALGQQARLTEWRDALALAVSREETPEGVHYIFSADAPAELRIRDLAAAEHECCSFLEFNVVRDANHLVMKVTAPPEEIDALRMIFPA